MRRRAFTLIELLVVIAIIALLVSILIPSLTQARELGRRAVCGSNQHSLHIGICIYAEDNNAWLPPWSQKDGNTGGSPYGTRNVFEAWAGTAYRYPNGDLIPRNLGHLWAKKLVSQKSLFFCPSQRSPYYMEKGYPPEYWELACPTNYGYLRTAFHYNPHSGRNSYGSAYGTRAYNRLNEVPLKKALIMDVLEGDEGIAHAGKTTAGWNLCLPTGAVVFRESREARIQIIGAPSPIANSWLTYEPVRNLLEQSPEW